MAEKNRKKDAVKAPDTARNDEHAKRAQSANESSEYCTKPFDPENSRSRDSDDPCVNGES